MTGAAAEVRKARPGGFHQIQHLPVAEVHDVLHTRAEGLEDGEVAERLLEVGRNSLVLPDPYKWVRKLRKQLTNFFTLLLLASAGVCFVADRLQPGESMAILGFALLGVSLLNAGVSFLQEFRAERAMEALQRFLPPRVWVRRGGESRTVLADELVPGDILLLSEGDRVAADARVVRCVGLAVNNAPLTGESHALGLETAPAAAGVPALEARNLVFGGCQVIRGSAEAVVYATGLRTEFGRVAHLSQTVRERPSPLEQASAQMVRMLTVIASLMGVAFFLYGVLSGRSLWVNLVFMMGIIVANVPEGLLPTFTLALAMGSLRMARKNVLVKRLSAVEGLGAVHVICTDKTGTLTENSLAVTRLVGPRGADAEPRGLAELGLLACDLRADDRGDEAGGLRGDPLDLAIARCVETHGGDVAQALAAIERRFPFDVSRARSEGIGRRGGRTLLAVKGAWERLRPLLDGVAGEAGVAPADAEALAAADRTVDRLARGGLRVIAVAWRALEAEEVARAQDPAVGPEAFERDLVLAGFLGLEDPLRPEVAPAIARCREAGIDVVMITGDHPETARAIARRCGILDRDAGGVLRGQALAELRQVELVEKLREGVRVFARTSPEQKMQIIAALKELDKVVAMTGDGVNDAPALKAADVGVAMGRGGTDVARESAQIILLDDNFASIVAGVEEGRTVYANIRRFTNYVLVSNGPEIVPYLLYVLLPVPLALTVIQILAIDLGTDIIPSMALGQEPPQPEQMRQPPRRRGEGLLSLPLVAHSYLFLGALEAAWSLFLFFYVLVGGGWEYGTELASDAPLYRAATGAALASILLMQIGNLLGRRFSRRSGIDRGVLRNRLMLLGIGIQVVFSWGVLYAPPLQAVLGTAPVDASVYLLAWLGVPLVFGCDYLRKVLFVRE